MNNGEEYNSIGYQEFMQKGSKENVFLFSIHSEQRKNKNEMRKWQVRHVSMFSH